MDSVKRAASIIFFFTFSIMLYAQDLPIEEGKIPKGDLEMKSFPKDTNAAAVILCDYGETHVNDDFDLEFTRIQRVKILNANGFKWGSHLIQIHSKDDMERINDIKGTTYNLEANGETTTSELDDDDIFKEEVDDSRTNYRFTLPNLKPGCVVEISYRIISTSLFDARDWTFQYDEPILWSEYRFCCPPNLDYAVVYMGFEPWYYNQVEQVARYYHGYAASILGSSVKCNQFRYIVKNAPAIREEPFITTVDDYVNKLNIQLAAYLFPTTGKKEVLKEWKSLISELFDNKHFYKEIDVTDDVQLQAEKITAGLNTPEEKMKAIYNWVSKSIVWDENNRMFADNEVDDILTQKNGSSAEINFLLLSLLKSVGINGYPVILSTRSNGKIQELYPMAFQFNYTITKAVINGKNYFLDPTNPYRPYDILPAKILGVKGLVIKEEEEPLEWVTFNTDKKNENKTVININVNQDGSLTGNVEDAYGEYKSISIRGDLANKKDMDIAKKLFDPESEGFSIDSVLVENKENLESSLTVKTNISSSIYAQKSGDLIYLNPFMIHRIKENPFKTQVRRYPVDYGYKSSSLMVMNFNLPEGYELKESLPIRACQVGNNASYFKKLSVQGNIVQVLSKMEIKNPIINPDEYDKLRDFYSQVVSAESEQLVIGPKKDKNSPVSTSTTGSIK